MGRQESFYKQQEESKELYKSLKSTLKKADKAEQAIELRANEVKQLISDKVSSVADDVRSLNAKASDEIRQVPETVGPVGPPGINGADGKNGENGANGKPGPQGPDGPVGVSGPPGQSGPSGDVGARGDAGIPGEAGGSGIPGIAGGPGVQGLSGPVDQWEGSGYDCPPSATATMRLRHCNRMGCRLETMFAGEWGSVCTTGFTDKDAGTVCKALGFVAGGTRYKGAAGFGSSHDMRIWLKDVKCNGNEGDVGDCQHEEWGQVQGCDRHMAVGVCCQGVERSKLGVRVGPSDFPKCPAASTKWARLRMCTQKSVSGPASAHACFGRGVHGPCALVR